MEVPFPLAASSRLMSFFTFQISMFFSASFAWASLISAVDGAVSARVVERFFVDRNLTLQYTVSRSIFSVLCGCDVGLWVQSEAIFRVFQRLRGTCTSA